MGAAFAITVLLQVVPAEAALTLDASGCSGTALDFGAVTVEDDRLTLSDCTVSYGTDSGDVQLRLVQQDGSGSAAPGIPDYGGGATWTSDGALLGACLRSISAVPVSGWSRPADAACDPIDADPWYGIAATSAGATSLVAEHSTGSYVASLRFGVRVDATTSAGAYSAPVTFEVIQPVVGPPSNMTLPVVSGTTTTGQQLSTTDGTWTGSPTSYTYQWRRCDAAGASCVDIAGATASTYTLVAADVDRTIRSVVTATNGSGSTPATSDQTAVIAGIAPTAGTASISGTATSGQTLTAGLTGWTAGEPAGATTYQWQRCDAAGANCVDIASATASSYVLADADVDATIRVRATRANTCTIGCGSVSATSGQTARVAGIAPTAGTASISGIAGVNQTLTAVESGTWTVGSPATSATYQWRRCDSAGANCVDIAGATGSTYTVANADIDQTIRVVITRTNSCVSGCGTATATSSQTGPVEPITFVGGASTGTSSGGGSSINVARPSGTQAGQLMVAQISVRGGTDQTITPPAGWTSIRRTNNSNRVALESFYRFATASEPSSYTFSWTDTDTATAAIVTFTNVDPTTPIDVAATSATGSSSTHIASGLTPTRSNTMLVALYAVRGGAGSYTPPTGMTERHDLTANFNITTLFATQRWSGTGATGTRSATSTINDDYAAQLVALRPAA